MVKTLLIATLFVIAATAASGQSLKEKNQRKEEDGILQAAVTETNKACGTRIKATWDWKSFKGKLQDGQGGHVGVYCALAVETMGGMCNAGDEAKEAIRAGVTTFLCKGTAAEMSEISLEKKTVIYATGVPDQRTGARYYVQQYLEEHL